MSNPRRRDALLVAAFTVFALALPARAQQSPPPQATPAAGQAEQPMYKLPMRGAPASRIGGGTRGPNVDSPAVTVFAPDHIGLTVNPQPTLYWQLSKEAPVRVELTVVDEAGVAPLIEKVEKPPLAAGIHALSLKDAGITLKPGVEYRWHVALVFDPKMRSSDVTSSGTIRVVAAPAGLTSKVADARGAPAAYAGEGLWYDSIDALMRLIAASPEDAQLKAQLDSLLAQVGLTRVAGTR